MKIDKRVYIIPIPIIAIAIYNIFAGAVVALLMFDIYLLEKRND